MICNFVVVVVVVVVVVFQMLFREENMQTDLVVLFDFDQEEIVFQL